VLQDFSAIHHIEDLSGRKIVDGKLNELIFRKILSQYLHRLRIEFNAGSCEAVPPSCLNGTPYAAANIQEPAAILSAKVFRTSFVCAN
jgi:hypothetical protein